LASRGFSSKKRFVLVDIQGGVMQYLACSESIGSPIMEKTEDIRLFLNRPLRIGNRWIKKRLMLAPMSGVGHVAFRELVSIFGGYGLLFTGMCNARALPTENRRVSPVFRWRDAELSELVCQIFGSDPQAMAAAARRIEAEGFFGVDINFGCAAAAICRRNCGAALLKAPEHAVHIVQAVRQAVSIPVFVKFRTGWTDRPEPAVDMARRFEDAGADALTFHPRVAPDRRSRPPKWEYIGLVTQAVSVPVFGNGDVFALSDCEKMIAVSGCDGVSLGRIAAAKPWVFAQWSDGLVPGEEIYRQSAGRLLNLLISHYGLPAAVSLFKKTAVYTASLFQYGHAFYKRIIRAEDPEQIEAELDAFFSGFPEPAARPNMNLFC